MGILFVILFGITSCTTIPQNPALSQAPAGSLGRPSDSNTEQLTFRFNLPQTKGFHAQNIDFSQIKYLRVWVTGGGIHDKIWNNEGFAPVTVEPNMTLTIQGVPKGKNRVVAAIGFDVNKQPIPGVALKGYYSSSAQSSAAMVTVYLKWRYSAVAEILEELLALNSTFLDTLDTQQLQALIDQIIYGHQPVDGATYAFHPSRMPVQAIAQTLLNNNGQLPATPPTDWKPKDSTVNVTVQNPSGQAFTKGFSFSVNDPSSQSVQITGGNLNATVTGVSVGEWAGVIRLSVDSSIKKNTALTVLPTGTVTMTPGNPLIFAPVLTHLTGLATAPTFTNIKSWWYGEDLAADKQTSYHGTVNGNVSLVSGMIGKGMSFDGNGDYISFGNISQFDFSNSSFTIEGWVKIADFPTNGGGCASRYPIFANSDWGYNLEISSVGKPYLIKYTSLGSSVGVFAPQPLSLNEFNHIAAVHTPTQMLLYINGQLVATTAISTGVIYYAPTDQPRIGRRFCGGTLFDFKGVIDELRIHEQALSTQEVSTIHQNRGQTIFGDGFDTITVNNDLTYNGVSQTIAGGNATTLIKTIQPHQFGVNPLQVTLGGYPGNSLVTSIPPLLGHLSRSLIMPGDSIVIAGSSFDNVPTNNQVSMNGTNAAVVAGTATNLTVTVPGGTTSGTITVSHSGGTSNALNYVMVPPNLVSWWRAENNANDSKGSHHGILAGNTTSVLGKVSNTFSLDGAGDYVDLSNTSDFRIATPKTIAGWFKTTASGTRQMIIQKGDAVIGFEWVIEVSPTGFLQAHFEVGTSAATIFCRQSSNALNDGKWHHFAVIYYTNPVSEDITLYIDGVENTTIAGLDSRATLNYASNTAKTVIGARSADSTPNLFFNGHIDEVQFYDRALLPNEIQSLL